MKIEKFSMKLYDKVIELWRKAGISVSSSDLHVDNQTRFYK